MTAVLCAVAALGAAVLVTPPAAAADNPTVVENQQPGTTSWQTGRAGFLVSDDRTGQVKGYASATSVNRGQSIDLKVSVNPAQSFTIDVYRMGWYGGTGGRLMAHIGPVAGTRQPACTSNTTTGMIDCAWSTSHRLAVPSTWTSGVYLALLTNSQKYQNYVTFVVRDDGRVADFLFQQSVTTYQAYNNYPDDGTTGKSLYEFNSRGSTVSATGTVRAAKVSFDRPYADGHGSGQFGGFAGNWERYYIGWLEQSGYDVTYSTNLDTHVSGARLLTVEGFLSVGHDEYWSKPMVDAATAARDAGVGLGFFGSNTAYWQVRFEPSVRGTDNRVMVCYKNASRDPVKDATATVQWRSPPVNQPEQRLVGVQYTAHLRNEGAGAAYVVSSSSHWVWAGTGFVNGDRVSGILGYETDRLMSEFPRPTTSNQTLLSNSPVIDSAGRSDVANSSIYQAPSGAWVFASGTNNWSYGLGKPGVTDVRIQRATRNVLDRFISAPAPTPPAAPSGLTAQAVSSTAIDLAWTDNATDETGYVVERSPTGTGTWTVVAGSLPAATTTFRDTGLTASTQYFYRVTATNAAGSSPYSNTTSATTTGGTVGPLFSETFSGADGSAWDSTRWTVSGSSGLLDQRGGQGRMRFENVSNAAAQAIARMSPTADSETVLSVRFPETAPRGYLYLFARASGNWSGGYPTASYFLLMRNDDNTAQLWKSQSGTTTLLASLTGAAAVTTLDQLVRLRVVGNTISARIWTTGTTEPTTWELTATDSTITTPGVFQARWWRSGSSTNAREVHLDNVAVHSP